MKVVPLAWALCASAAVLLPVAVRADPPAAAPGGVYNSFESTGQARDAGSLSGSVESVDYGAGTLVLRTPHGVMRITVLPSTSIYKRDEYATLADVRRGASVEVSAYELGGRLIARIIRLK